MSLVILIFELSSLRMFLEILMRCSVTLAPILNFRVSGTNVTQPRVGLLNPQPSNFELN
jgi:hypothetical protein